MIFVKVPRATPSSPLFYGVPTTFGEPQYCIFTPKNLGHYKVTINTLARGAEVMSPLQTMTAAMIPPINDFSFDDQASLGYFILDLPQAPNARSKAARQMRAFGIKWVRFAYRPYNDKREIAPDFSDPNWLWNAEDFISQVDTLRTNGIQVLAQIFGSPKWASQFPDDESKYQSFLKGWQIAAPKAPDWGKILSEIASRLKGKVNHWEIWNEPESYIYFSPQSITASIRGHNYKNLLVQSSNILKSIDSNNKTVVNPANFNQKDWNSVVFSESNNQYLDVYGVLDEPILSL